VDENAFLATNAIDRMQFVTGIVDLTGSLRMDSRVNSKPVQESDQVITRL
jgi:hypothetical protein